MLAGAAFVIARPGTAPTATPQPQVQPLPTPAGPQTPTAGATASPGTQAQAPTEPSQGSAPGELPASPGGATVATSVTDAPPAVEDTEAPHTRKAVPKTAPRERVSLGIDDIQRVVSNGRSKITGCFERYKSDLPSSAGEVQVQLTIVSSGKVRASTRGPLASTAVGRCLETQAQSLRFPAHRDQEVTVLMPFSWKVTQ